MQRKRIASALGAGVLSEIANKVFPLLTLHFVANRLGVQSFGVSQFAQWLLDLAVFFIGFGYQGAGMLAWRGASERERPQIFAASVVLRVIHAVIAGLVLVLAISWNANWGSYKSLVINSIFVLGTSAIDGIWAMTALGLLPMLSFISVAAKTLSLITIFALVRGSEDATMYTLITMGANALVSFGTFVVVVRKLGWQWPSGKILRTNFFGALPFALSFLLLIGLERFDMAMVENLAGAAGVGAYAGPAKIAQSLIPIAGMVTTVFFAEMLNIFDRESTVRHLRAGLRVAFLFLTPIIAGVWFVDRDVVGLILGQSFVPHARLLSVLSTSILAHMLLLALGNQILVLQHRVHSYNLSLALGLAVGVSYAYVFGGHGDGLAQVAFASALGRWTAAIIVVIIALRVVGDGRGVLWEMLRSSVPALLMAAGIYLIGPESFVATVMLGAIIHVSASMVMFRDTVWRVIARPT